jgi:hypothetical protein
VVRARAWSTVLNLIPKQLQALNDATMAELWREAEESLQIDSRNGSAPMDALVCPYLGLLRIWAAPARHRNGPPIPATGVSTLLLTTVVMIADTPKDDADHGHSGSPGGMGM